MNVEAERIFDRVTHCADAGEAVKNMTDHELCVLLKGLRGHGIATAIPGNVLGLCYVESAERFLNAGGAA